MKKYIVLYSAFDALTHIESLDRCLAHNQKLFLEGKITGYAPIGLFDTNEEAEEFGLEFLAAVRRKGIKPLKGESE